MGRSPVRAGRLKVVAKALTLVPDGNGPSRLLERYGRGREHRHTHLPGAALADPFLGWAECLAIPEERVAWAV
jgi:hypothetical protein